MVESGSSRNSSFSSNDSDESSSTYSSVEASEELHLSLPSEVLPYRFEPIYNSDEEPAGPSTSESFSLPTETEDSEVSRVGNTDW